MTGARHPGRTPQPSLTASVLECAWLLGGHTWRIRARWNWRTNTQVLINERCPRCGLTRPIGGYFSARSLGFAGDL